MTNPPILLGDGNGEMKTVAVFGASTTSPDTSAYQEGVDCGRLLAEAGFAVATGGYGGTMEAVSLGAHSIGGHVVGVTAPAVFPHRSGANRYVTEEVPAASLVERIGLLVGSSDASIALPGSLGTATELMVAWNLAMVGAADTKPAAAVGPQWARFVSDLERQLDISPGLIDLAADAAEAVRIVSARLG